MTKGIRIALWILSSLAVLWTVGALVMAVAMGGMMGGACPMCGLGMGGGMMGQGAGGRGGMMSDTAMRGGMAGGGWMMGGMMWMMLAMGLTWLVMLGLDAIFVYLVVTALRRRRSAGLPTAG